MVFLNGAIVGILAGAAYSLVAVSITLMFRTTGVLSFTHAAFAMVGAYAYADFAGKRHWPGPLAALAALVVTIVYGLIVERVAIRAVRHSSASTKLIVTLGVLELTTGLVLQRYGFAPISAPLLLPDRFIAFGSVRFSYQQVAVLLAAAAMAGLLALFLQRARFGTAIRAAAENPEAAELMGISLPQVARFNWALGATLAGVTGILVAPLSVITAATFPLLLARALTATLVGGLVSLPLTFLGGLLVGIVQSLVVIKSSTAGAQDLATLLFVVALLVGRRRWPAELTSVTAPTVRLNRLAPLTRRIADLYGRSAWLWPALLVGGAFLAVYVPARSGYWAFVGARGLVYVIESLSIVILVGWGGQVSLMHGAYVGIGAFTTAYLVHGHGWPIPLSVLVAALVGMGMGAIAGLPALRLSGLQFGIASLAFGAAASEWLFKRPQFPKNLPRGSVLGLDLFNDSHLYLVMLPITVVLYVLVWNVRRSTFGALLLCARDAPQTVAHFGADPRRVRMAAFLFASFIAGLGGALYGVLLSGFQPADFAFSLSIQLLIFAVVGGSQSLAGPLLAGLLFGVVPQLIQGQAGASASAGPDIVAGGLVVVLMALRPGGLASLFARGSAVGRTQSAAAALGPGRFGTTVRTHHGSPRTRTQPRGADLEPGLDGTATLDLTTTRTTTRTPLRAERQLAPARKA